MQVDKTFEPGIPMPIHPPIPIPTDPVRLAAALKVLDSEEYANLKSVLTERGAITYQGTAYTANTLDKLVAKLVNDTELRDQPNGADYIANHVRGILKGLAEAHKLPPVLRIGEDIY